jgi:hypothetical protein
VPFWKASTGVTAPSVLVGVCWEEVRRCVKAVRAMRSLVAWLVAGTAMCPRVALPPANCAFICNMAAYCAVFRLSKRICYSVLCAGLNT